MTAQEAFEKWWQGLSLPDDTLTYDHIRQAWYAGVLFEREAAAVIAENFVLGETADGRSVWADDVAKEIRDQRD